MTYKVAIHFYDLQDKRHEYLPGDNYPRKGYKPDAERIAFLLGKGAIVEEKPKRRKKADAN